MKSSHEQQRSSVRATPRGKDFLKAIIAVSIVSSIIDIKLMLALGFTLSMIALISYVIVRRPRLVPEKNVFLSPSSMRGFKGEEEAARLRLEIHQERFASIEIGTVDAPEGVEVRHTLRARHAAEIHFKPRFAGLFNGVVVKTEVKDELGLFARTLSIAYANFSLESLPLSLLIPVQRAMPFLLALGERTAGSKGVGQEFYSIDDYAFGDKRDILWKRVAQNPDERLVVRLRESNIPKEVKVGLVEFADRTSEERLRWMDLCLEGIALIGRNLIVARCRLKFIVNATKGGAVQIPVADEADLADGIMMVAASSRSEDRWSANSAEVINSSDIVVTGMKETEDPNFARALARKLSLVIEEESTPAMLGRDSLIFTGVEDVRRLISRAVEK
jgi:hypothetical protein